MSKSKSFVKIIPFKPTEIIQIAETAKLMPKTAETKSWLTVVAPVEKKASATMEKNKVSFNDVYVTDLNRVSRPLVLEVPLCVTRSKVSQFSENEGKIPTNVTFTTRILVPHAIGDVLKDGTVVDEKWIESELRKDASAQADRDPKVGEMTPEKKEAKIAALVRLLKAEYNLWRAYEYISDEYKANMTSRTYKRTFGADSVTPDKVGTNIRYHRKANEEDGDDAPDRIPLEHPMVRHRISVFSVTPQYKKYVPKVIKVAGDLFTRVMKRKSKEEPNTLEEVMVNSRPLTYESVKTYITPYSAITGEEKFSVCVSSQGAHLQSTFTTMIVQRGPKQVGMSQTITEDMANDMNDAFGDYDEDEDEPVGVPATEQKEIPKTSIEEQMAYAGLDDDE